MLRILEKRSLKCVICESRLLKGCDWKPGQNADEGKVDLDKWTEGNKHRDVEKDSERWHLNLCVISQGIMVLSFP